MAEPAEQTVEETPEQDSPALGGGDDTPPEETAAPGEGDDTQADTPPEEDTGDETPDEGEGEPPAPGRSKAFQKLLDKYGGDEDALVNAYFEQANSSSRLHQEIEELRDYLMARDVEDEDPAALVAEDPDVKSLNEELSSLQQETEAIQQEQMQLVGQYGTIEADIKSLTKEAAKAEDFEKTSLNQQVSSKQGELARTLATINQGRREMGRIAREANALQRAQKHAERSVLDRRETAKKEELKSAQVARLTREEFNTAMREEAKKYGVTPDSKQFAVLNSSVRNQISSHLNRLPKDAPGIDITAAVQHLMGEYADAWGMKSDFKKRSDAVRGRSPVTSGPRPTGGPPLPKGMAEPKMPKGMKQFGPDGKNWTKEYSSWRAERFLGS